MPLSMVEELYKSAEDAAPLGKEDVGNDKATAVKKTQNLHRRSVLA